MRGDKGRPFSSKLRRVVEHALNKKNRARTRTRLKSFVFLDTGGCFDEAMFSLAAAAGGDDMKIMNVHFATFGPADEMDLQIDIGKRWSNNLNNLANRESGSAISTVEIADHLFPDLYPLGKFLGWPFFAFSSRGWKTKVGIADFAIVSRDAFFENHCSSSLICWLNLKYFKYLCQLKTNDVRGGRKNMSLARDVVLFMY